MLSSARSCAFRGDFDETCAASSNAKLHDELVGSANGDRYEPHDHDPSLTSRDDERRLLGMLLLSLLKALALAKPVSTNISNIERSPASFRQREDMSKSYVIEVGDDQAGLIIREDGERDYLFHAALGEYSALEGRRFANAFLAERAAIAHASSRRRRRTAISGREAFAL